MKSKLFIAAAIMLAAVIPAYAGQAGLQREFAAARAVDECYWSAHSMVFAVKARDGGVRQQEIFASLSNRHGHYVAKAMVTLLYHGPALSPSDTAETWFQDCKAHALRYYGVSEDATLKLRAK